ncbi:protein NO VEIN domain-containing protein [Deinococcus aquaticus]|uniref:protein NO VEIN domain-containing protein n=1 Tax=Deinococcus aquaticus TaxID=328692 RepID=UPI0030AF9F4C
MARKFALRRIQHSELPFFQIKLDQARAEQKLTGRGVSKQKAINFDKDVIHQYYPGLAEDQKHPVRLMIYGPDDLREYEAVPAPPILLQDKNWRIGGGAVRSPDADPQRYAGISVNDFLFFEFLDGPDGRPAAVNMLILSATEQNGLSAQLNSLFAARGRANFIPLSEQEMAALRRLSRVMPADPLSIFGDTEQEAIEEALLGDALAADYLHRRGRYVSPEELARRQERRAATGAAGELLVNSYLTAQQAEGAVDWFEHESAVDTVAPFDFKIGETGGAMVYMDVKSTSGTHDTQFHLSGAELAFAAASEEPYLIYRVSGLTDEGAWLQVSSDLRPHAQEALNVLARLPAGMTLTGMGIRPDLLTWSEPVWLSLPAPASE